MRVVVSRLRPHLVVLLQQPLSICLLCCLTCDICSALADAVAVAAVAVAVVVAAVAADVVAVGEVGGIPLLLLLLTAVCH